MRKERRLLPLLSFAMCSVELATSKLDSVFLTLCSIKQDVSGLPAASNQLKSKYSHSEGVAFVFICNWLFFMLFFFTDGKTGGFVEF